MMKAKQPDCKMSEHNISILNLKINIFDCDRILFWIKMFLNYSNEPIKDSQFRELKDKYSLICNSDELTIDKNDRMGEIIQDISEQKWDSFTKEDVQYAQSTLLNMMHQIDKKNKNKNNKN